MEVVHKSSPPLPLPPPPAPSLLPQEASSSPDEERTEPKPPPPPHLPPLVPPGTTLIPTGTTPVAPAASSAPLPPVITITPILTTSLPNAAATPVLTLSPVVAASTPRHAATKAVLPPPTLVSITSTPGSSANGPTPSAEQSESPATPTLPPGAAATTTTPVKKRRRRHTTNTYWTKRARKKIVPGAGSASASSVSGGTPPVPPTSLPDCCCGDSCLEKVGEEERKRLFHLFWGLGSLTKQRAYLSERVVANKEEPKTCDGGADDAVPPTPPLPASEGQVKLEYHLDSPSGEEPVHVCRPFFRFTLGASNRMLNRVVAAKTEEASPSPPPDTQTPFRCPYSLRSPDKKSTRNSPNSTASSPGKSNGVVNGTGAASSPSPVGRPNNTNSSYYYDDELDELDDLTDSDDGDLEESGHGSLDASSANLLPNMPQFVWPKELSVMVQTPQALIPLSPGPGHQLQAVSCKCWHGCSSKITEQQRRKIFQHFWSLSGMKQQEYLSSLIFEMRKKKTQLRGGKPSRRKYSCEYYLAVDGHRFQVCLNYFVKTLDVTINMVRVILKNRRLRQEGRTGVLLPLPLAPAQSEAQPQTQPKVAIQPASLPQGLPQAWLDGTNGTQLLPVAPQKQQEPPAQQMTQQGKFVVAVVKSPESAMGGKSECESSWEEGGLASDEYVDVAEKLEIILTVGTEVLKLKDEDQQQNHHLLHWSQQHQMEGAILMPAGTSCSPSSYRDLLAQASQAASTGPLALALSHPHQMMDQSQSAGAQARSARPPRRLEPVECRCWNQCNMKISEKHRQQIFNHFWQLGSYSLQRQFLLSHVVDKKKRCIRSPKGTDSRRKYTCEYYLDAGGHRVQVCQRFFIKTLGISGSLVHLTLRKKRTFGIEMAGVDRRGLWRSLQTDRPPHHSGPLSLPLSTHQLPLPLGYSELLPSSDPLLDTITKNPELEITVRNGAGPNNGSVMLPPPAPVASTAANVFYCLPDIVVRKREVPAHIQNGASQAPTFIPQTGLSV